jgi:flavin reductase (DIM6/NTAB) family NADH-FMN oxidoreductase RutF
MKKQINYESIVERFNEQLQAGIFLNSSYNGEFNTMTIGWGTVGVIWGKPIVCVAVRESRHTFSIIEKSNKFTISIPKKGGLKKELAFCGTNSGSNTDKFTACGFKKDVIVDKCDLHIECDVVYQQFMDKNNLNENIKDRYYGNNDYHMFYYGEIKDCYYTEEEVVK